MEKKKNSTKCKILTSSKWQTSRTTNFENIILVPPIASNRNIRPNVSIKKTRSSGTTPTGRKTEAKPTSMITLSGNRKEKTQCQSARRKGDVFLSYKLFHILIKIMKFPKC